MCSNFEPVVFTERLQATFGVSLEGDTLPSEAWPMSIAPVIFLAEDGRGKRICQPGLFGLLPHFATELSFGRKTYNARSETVASKPSFRQVWAEGQRCIIPAERIFESNWETGKAVRWAIQDPRASAMAIAGLYSRWRTPDGRAQLTFAMLTVTADGHPVMQRFHKPGDEKRMVVILDEAQINDWCACPVSDAQKFLTPKMSQLHAYAAPLPPRIKKAAHRALPVPQNGELF